MQFYASAACLTYLVVKRNVAAKDRNVAGADVDFAICQANHRVRIGVKFNIALNRKRIDQLIRVDIDDRLRAADWNHDILPRRRSDASIPIAAIRPIAADRTVPGVGIGWRRRIYGHSIVGK